LDSATSG